MIQSKLNKPIFVAAWPGMGHVAVTACYYLIAKLKMELRAEYATSELFDADHVVVESGLVQPFRYPKSQVFAWKNEQGENDLLIFIGEAQPPTGRYDFCRKLIDYVQREGVASIYTFAAMATDIDLGESCRVVGAATDKDTAHQFLENDVNLLRSGSISGMNGILLGVAAERQISGGCLLGEMPESFVNVPFPKASLAILESFSQLTGIDVDTAELSHEAQKIEAHLSQMLDHIKKLSQQSNESNPEEFEIYMPDPAENGKLSDEEKRQIEALFHAAKRDRTAAFDLKRELDRLDVFREYEDRFLDLFKSENGSGNESETEEKTADDEPKPTDDRE